MAEPEGLNVPAIATVGAVSVALTTAVVIGVQALYYRYAGAEVERKVIEAPTATADSRIAEQEARLARYSWLQRSDGRTTIPIERAMQLIVREHLDAQSEADGTDATPEGGP
jgi:hypothetical protein